MFDPVFQYCLLGSFALLFALSAAEKFGDRVAFRDLLRNYRILPTPLVPLTAVLVPMIEIATATLLVTTANIYGVTIGLVLMMGYALAIWINLLRGRTHIDCGCLGSRKEGISYLHVVRNLCLALILSTCLLTPLERQLIWLDYFVVTAFIATSMLIFSNFSHLLTGYMDQRSWWS